MRYFLTVIVPVYKVKEEYLRNCADSLLNQSRDDYLVLFVEDGSPDGCGKICDEYRNKYGNVEVIHQSNQGVSTARNNAIDAAKTEWITFIDADDWVEPDYVSSIYEAVSGGGKNSDIILFDYTHEFKTHSQLDTMDCAGGVLDEEQIEVCRKGTYYKHISNGKFNTFSVIAVWNKVYRAAFLNRSGLRFQKNLVRGEDRVFNADAFLSARSFFYIKKVLQHYRCLSSSVANSYNEKVVSQTVDELLALEEVVKKHGIWEKAKDCVYYRISTRLYNCMRLYYFNEKNPKSYRENVREIKQLTATPLFAEALKNVNLGLLSTQEKIFVILTKARLFGVCRLLVRLKSGSKDRKLE